ncbi:MAG: LON peptidase substrate-binding domain-containing protein [Dongiaceae bacterium]
MPIKKWFDAIVPVKEFPVFPLPGALLLPRAKLPLTIFEPRYIHMIEDALAAGHRTIGMIQPLDGQSIADDAPLYKTGCAGRITSFNETDDGRFLITLTGIARFDVKQDHLTKRGYRLAEPDFTPYARDVEAPGAIAIDRERLIKSLREYFAGVHDVQLSMQALQDTTDEILITSLAIICPFEPKEKQAILEAPDFAARATIVLTLLEMLTLSTNNPGNTGTVN